MTTSPETISAWSFSRLEVYKNCPRQAKLKYVSRCTEAPRPKPVKGKEHANERGSRVHDNAENYVLSKEDTLCTEAKYFEDELLCLRIMKECHPERVQTEEMWLFDKDWNVLPPETSDDPETRKTIWLRIIADLQIWNHEMTTCQIIDYKTGKRDRNEIKHGKQLQLYQLAGFMRYPKLQHVKASLWYIDLNLQIDTPFTREKGLKYFSIYNDQAITMCADTEFEVRASAYRCRFCPFGPIQTSNKWINKTGDCPHGV